MISPQTPILQSSVHSVPPSFDFERGEVLNINKPEGWTSFDVVKRVRRHTGVRKVGHAGTLDPFATGVLLVCTGRATKRVSEFMNSEKEYEAEIVLGKVTDTYDCTGTVLREEQLPTLTFEIVKATCDSFVGESHQTPPMYSAIKVNGTRLYKLARKGMTVDREARKINILGMEVLAFRSPLIQLRITCSKGTYIRSLAYDVGEKLGCGAYLSMLTRTRIGGYRIEDAYPISDFS